MGYLIKISFFTFFSYLLNVSLINSIELRSAITKQPLIRDYDNGEFEVKNEASDGVKVGCSGFLRSGVEEIAEVFVEDEFGHREINDLSMPQAKLKTSDGSIIDKFIPFQLWPKICFTNIFAKFSNSWWGWTDDRNGNGWDSSNPGGWDSSTNGGWASQGPAGWSPSNTGWSSGWSSSGNEGGWHSCGCVVGVPGSPGQTGPPGADGKAGRDGRPGRDGQNANNGENGPVGPPGQNGQDGTPGQAGQAGPKGPPGDDGKDGVDGEPGEPGKPGMPGKPGTDGADGADGVDAPDAQNGDDGDNGDAGEPGRPGDPGAPGKPGYGGFSGEPGYNRPNTPPGKNGIPGLPGRPGTCSDNPRKSTNNDQTCDPSQGSQSQHHPIGPSGTQSGSSQRPEEDKPTDGSGSNGRPDSAGVGQDPQGAESNQRPRRNRNRDKPSVTLTQTGNATTVQEKHHEDSQTTPAKFDASPDENFTH